MTRRTTAAACLVAAPVLHAASYFLWPPNSEGTHAEQLAAAGTHSTSWAAATAVETVGWLILIPALAVIWHEVRGRGRVLTSVGLWLSMLGLVGFYGAGVMNLVTIGLGSYGERAAALGLVDALRKNGDLFLFVVAPIMLGSLAFVVLFAGLARARWIGWWAPIAAFIGVAASQVLSSSANPILLTLAFAPAAAAFIATGRHLLTSDDIFPSPVAAPAPLPA